MRRILGCIVSLTILLRRPCHGAGLRRRAQLEGCQSSRAFTFEMSRELIVKTRHAAELVNMTYGLNRLRCPPKGDFDTVAQMFDVNDAALVARRNHTCYAAFSPTSRTNPFDIWQLFDGRKRELNGCLVRRGFHGAYFSRYYKIFIKRVDECMETATELILTGHSQGGSNAMVAFVDLQRYNPIAITFGAIRALVEPCSAIDASRIYRYINVGYQLYDGWAYLGGIDAGVHMGHSILLDVNSTTPAVYLGLNEDITRSPTDSDVHDIHLYWKALDAMVKKAEAECPIGPVRLGGFEYGHWCTHDDECYAGLGCIQGFCSP